MNVSACFGLFRRRQAWLAVVVACGVAVFQACKPDPDVQEPVPQRGAIIYDSLIYSFNKTQADSFLKARNLALLPVQNGLRFYRIKYHTPDPVGGMTTASAGIVLPILADPSTGVPMLAYNHGTISKRKAVPSYGGLEQTLGVVMASQGFCAVLSDYLGLGDSDFPYHPYIHASSEATAIVDALRAAKTLAARESVALNGKLFLAGYSQGGHATMAAHRELQTKHAGEFTVTASAPLAGPHDLGGVQADMIASDQEYAVPSYLPFFIIGYNNIYKLYPSLSDIIKPEYMASVIPMFNGEYSNSQIDALMPKVPKEIIKPEVMAAYVNDPNHPLRRVLADNNTHTGWVPQAPIFMAHCTSDEEVSYQNSVVARRKFAEQGADTLNNIRLTSPSSTLTHFQCAEPSILSAYLWFQNFR
jgi:predicted esterase